MSWQVTNGFFVVSGSDQNGAESDTNKVVRVNDHELVLDDEGDTVTFRK